MKSFNDFLENLNDGKTLAGLTSDFAELLREVRNTGRSGSLTLKVKVAPTGKGQHEVDKVTIVADRKLELPRQEQPSDFFYLTEDDQPEVSRKHPRQQALDLRDVASQPVLSTALPPRAPLAVVTSTAAPLQPIALDTPEGRFTTPDADGVVTLKTAL